MLRAINRAVSDSVKGGQDRQEWEEAGNGKSSALHLRRHEVKLLVYKQIELFLLGLLRARQVLSTRVRKSQL